MIISKTEQANTLLTEGLDFWQTDSVQPHNTLTCTHTQTHTHTRTHTHTHMNAHTQILLATCMKNMPAIDTEAKI